MKYQIICTDTKVSPVVQQKIDKDKYIVVAEINMNRVNTFGSQAIKVEQVSRYPVTTLDFNFVLNSDEVYGKIENVAHTIKTELVYKVQLIDIFNNVSDNTKSYTIRYMVTSMDHTLSSNEIEDFHKNVIDTFEKNDIHLKAE